MIRPAEQADAARIAGIYNHYVVNTTATFELEPVPDQEMARRIRSCQENGFPWLVAEDRGAVVGYCYATAWKGRPAYLHSVEASVYLAPPATARGWGTALYRQLLDQLQGRGIHAVICGIVLPNAASVALHEKLGMEKVAQFKEVGRKFGRWIDVGYWQCLL